MVVNPGGYIRVLERKAKAIENKIGKLIEETKIVSNAEIRGELFVILQEEWSNLHQINARIYEVHKESLKKA